MSRTSKTTQTREIPEWLRGGSEHAVGRAREIADRPYEAYQDQRIAGLSEGEQTAIDRAQAQGQDYQSDLTRARGLTEQGAQSFVDADIQGYMNPYIEGALDPAARELREQIAREQREIGSQAGNVGAFGGSRQAILESESRRGGNEAISDLYGRGYAGAFESARDQFNRDRDAFARGAEQFRATGAQGQQQLTQDIQNLLTTGGLQRNLEQAGMDFDYSQFIEARDWDVTNLGPLLQTLSTVPHGETQTTSQKKSTFDTVLGAAATVAGAYFTGGASLAAGGQEGGFFKKIGVGFGEMLGGEGAGMTAFGDDGKPQPTGGTGAGGGYVPPSYLPGFDGAGMYGTPPYAEPISSYSRAA